ncbi:hypothetical protein TNCV_1228981 [Trichonephila clavipes]|nr:hypothetical protein TNCV_1228981 [Trichonephila clavipes]
MLNHIKCPLKLKKSAMKTFQILTGAYGDETLPHAYVFEWHKGFSRGRGSVKDDERAGSLRTEVAKVGGRQENSPSPQKNGEHTYSSL